MASEKIISPRLLFIHASLDYILFFCSYVYNIRNNGVPNQQAQRDLTRAGRNVLTIMLVLLILMRNPLLVIS